jgi:hypothetical protein
MAKESSKTAKDSLSLPAEDMIELTLMSNELLGDDATINSYQVRNSRALAKAKSLVCYKNGITKLPASVKRLQADALRKDDHSLALSGNMQLARGELQRPGTDAHHIVSRTHRLAKYSRKYLFDWRIGIDDADNGVFLPEQFGANIPGIEKANAHSPIHTRLYHLEVASRLSGRRTEPATAGRAELQGMRADMIAGTFPYKKA